MPIISLHADLANLCAAMPYMSACSLRSKCTGSATAADGVPAGCSAFDLVATICKWVCSCTATIDT